MLQYDFTTTGLFNKPSRATLPSDAEMFTVTAALLLAYEATYSDLEQGELVLSEANVHTVAECIEIRLPELARDLERFGSFRRRLMEFVGMRVAGSPAGHRASDPKPT